MKASVGSSPDQNHLPNKRFRIPVNTPFDFSLYSHLALIGEVIPLPYLYSATDWRCLVRISSGKRVPVCVYPSKEITSSHLTIRAFGDFSSGEEREIRETTVRIFCSELDLSKFYRKASKDAHFFKFVKRLYGLKPHLSQDPFEAVIKAVVRQLVRADMARRSISLLVRKFGDVKVVNGDIFYSFPCPETLSNASKSHLVECKIGYKWQLIKRLASDVASGDLDFKELDKLSDEKVIEILTQYIGIGYWTSRILLYDGLGRLDSYPIHDISLKRAVSGIYFRGQSISWKEVEDFFADHKDYVGIAVNYLFGALWLQRTRSFRYSKAVDNLQWT